MLNQYGSWNSVRPHSPVTLFEFLDGFDVCARIVSPMAITSTRITPSVSQKTVIMDFPVEGVVLNFFFLVIADDATPLAQKVFILWGH